MHQRGIPVPSVIRIALRLGPGSRPGGEVELGEGLRAGEQVRPQPPLRGLPLAFGEFEFADLKEVAEVSDVLARPPRRELLALARHGRQSQRLQVVLQQDRTRGVRRGHREPSPASNAPYADGKLKRWGHQKRHRTGTIQVAGGGGRCGVVQVGDGHEPAAVEQVADPLGGELRLRRRRLPRGRPGLARQAEQHVRLEPGEQVGQPRPAEVGGGQPDRPPLGGIHQVGEHLLGHPPVPGERHLLPLRPPGYPLRVPLGRRLRRAAGAGGVRLAPPPVGAGPADDLRLEQMGGVLFPL